MRRGEAVGETEDIEDIEDIEEAEEEEREGELRVEAGEEMTPLLRVDMDDIVKSVSLAEGGRGGE